MNKPSIASSVFWSVLFAGNSIALGVYVFGPEPVPSPLFAMALGGCIIMLISEWLIYFYKREAYEWRLLALEGSRLSDTLCDMIEADRNARP